MTLEQYIANYSAVEEREQGLEQDLGTPYRNKACTRGLNSDKYRNITVSKLYKAKVGADNVTEKYILQLCMRATSLLSTQGVDRKGIRKTLPYSVNSPRNTEEGREDDKQIKRLFTTQFSRIA